MHIAQLIADQLKDDLDADSKVEALAAIALHLQGDKEKSVGRQVRKDTLPTVTIRVRNMARVQRVVSANPGVYLRVIGNEVAIQGRLDRIEEWLSQAGDAVEVLDKEPRKRLKSLLPVRRKENGFQYSL